MLWGQDMEVLPSFLISAGTLLMLRSSVSSCHRLPSCPSSGGSSRRPGLLRKEYTYMCTHAYTHAHAAPISLCSLRRQPLASTPSPVNQALISGNPFEYQVQSLSSRMLRGRKGSAVFCKSKSLWLRAGCPPPIPLSYLPITLPSRELLPPLGEATHLQY